MGTKLIDRDFFLSHPGKGWKELGRLLGVDRHTVAKYARLYGIPARENASLRKLDYSKSHITDSMLEAVDGFLLGDGSIRCRPGARRNANFCWTQKHREMAEYVASFFQAYKPVVSDVTFWDDRYGKKYYSTKSSTCAHPDITAQYKRWYPNRVKKIPEDVRVTPASVMLWYLGDGDFSGRVVRLHTQSFSTEEVKFVAARLSDVFNIKTTTPRSGKGLYIRVATSDTKFFFKQIGECPIECYKYRFPELHCIAKGI